MDRHPGHGRDGSGRPPGRQLDLEDPVEFDRCLGEVGIASLIVAAGSRMGPLMRRLYEPSDVVQEAILTAWRDRSAFSGTDLRALRGWLLTIIDRRIHDLARRETTQKRGGGSVPASLASGTDDDDGGGGGGGARTDIPFQSTTPSRMVRRVEEARRIELALDGLGEPERSLIMLTVYDVESVSEAARRLDLSDGVARDRLRRGLAELNGVIGEWDRDPDR